MTHRFLCLCHKKTFNIKHDAVTVEMLPLWVCGRHFVGSWSVFYRPLGRRVVGLSVGVLSASRFAFGGLVVSVLAAFVGLLVDVLSASWCTLSAFGCCFVGLLFSVLSASWSVFSQLLVQCFVGLVVGVVSLFCWSVVGSFSACCSVFLGPCGRCIFGLSVGVLWAFVGPLSAAQNGHMKI